MTDQVGISTGEDAQIAAELISGVYYQLMKLVAGDDDSTVPIKGTASYGLYADIKRIAAGENNIGKVDSPITTPTIYNVTLASANTEYSQALPANCRYFEIQCRTAYDVRFAFVTGKVATPTAPYATLKSGGAYSSPQVAQGASPSTIYLASSQAGVVVEIIAYT